MDARSPRRFLLSVLLARKGLVTSSVVAGTAWLLAPAALPLVIGQAIDHGIAERDTGALLLWGSIVLAIGLVQACASAVHEWSSHTLWLHGAHLTHDQIVQQAAALGASLPKQIRVGEVVAMGTDDVDAIGDLCENLGRFIGAAIAFVGVSIALLVQSPLLGLVAFIGVPLAVLSIGPLMRPLHRRKEAQRDKLAEVNAMGSDIVGGLRVLRGIGGERAFFQRYRSASQRVAAEGIRVGRIESWLPAAGVLLPGLVTVAVTVIGVWLAVDGQISVGSLIAFYGASVFLVIPVQAATETAESYSAARVAAGRVCRLLRLRPQPESPAVPVPLPSGPLELRCGTWRIAAGQLTVIPPAPDRAELFAGLGDGSCTIGGVRADQIERDELRDRVVLVRADAIWFSGPVGPELELGTGVPVHRAVHAASAEDVLAGFPDGWQEVISERGRSVSGGQRQRLGLARALTLDPDVLVLEDPTAAVDAHTEECIAQRIAKLRAGRTTLVCSASPLWKAVADVVLEIDEPKQESE
ncbi:ABC-type multidrug transport system fused ATPase/permease subunit [Tamaricihabitans halophyticus]|uniref:ABC-type multidrug transport system fused ATPase/permease subunit n=1 Tax=Tamaricihabitans halophyticus TaxID=1262583 RepID=A0A4R2QVA8_9PSEU|nr:ABC transporter ATP-binding protein [Tamaricihabitans halophyticus]TCP53224.1 ABC-type multidrug transport system fused ATPase/permease subunit [Tamaricihabitans halophyticus]